MNDALKTHTRIKICGLTSVEDVRSAVAFGADAIGMVFYEKSLRNITIEVATELAREAGPFVTTVGLFVNPEKEFVQRVLKQVPLQLLQFHGDETAAFCEQFERPYIKALRVKNRMNASHDEVKETQASIIQESEQFKSAQGILLDTYSEKGRGGTGESFNWDCVPDMLPSSHIILAGGLSLKNVGSAIKETHPYAVDVSSGVESSPGKKNHKAIAGFISAVRKQI